MSDAWAVVNREVAYRLFATEFDDADFEYSESDEERAPNYVVTPSGTRINRLYFVGVLTETEQVNEEVLRARVVDPTGAFVVYAGQYQPDALAFLESTDSPEFVAVTGKARTFQPDDSDRTFTSVRPETISAVEAADRDRWAVTAAEHTLDRVATMADALGRSERGADLTEALVAEGVPVALADGVALAIDHYDTSAPYLNALRTLALDASRVVAGDREEVRDVDPAPDDPGDEAIDREALSAVGPDILTPDDGAETVGDAGTSTAADETTASADAEATTTEEATAESADTTTETATADDDLGDFEGGSIATDEEETEGAEAAEDEAASGEATVESADEATADAPTADTDEMYEFDEDERQEIEEEYGTEFSTGAEVESPETGRDAAPSAETEDEATVENEATVEDEAAEEAKANTAEETAADEGKTEAAAESEVETTESEANGESADAEAPVEDVLLETMRELDDGDGAPRSELIGTVVDRTGTDEPTVEDAIQEALMGGQCYEPEDDRLKPI
jgi:RPA family protein